MGEAMRLLAILAVLFIAGCVQRPTAEQIAAADHGAYPEQYETLIKSYYEGILIDPTSPIYTFEAPQKGYIAASILHDVPTTFGWRVCGTINAKNRMGGYTGRKPFYALIRNGRVVIVTEDFPGPCRR